MITRRGFLQLSGAALLGSILPIPKNETMLVPNYLPVSPIFYQGSLDEAINDIIERNGWSDSVIHFRFED